MVLIHWLIAFAATCAIELAVVRAMVRDARPTVILAAQAATHPALWILMAVLPLPSEIALAVLETAAMAAESAIYRRRLGLPWPSAIAVSAVANAGSLAVGVLLGA
jgi:hypothetical protein